MTSGSVTVVQLGVIMCCSCRLFGALFFFQAEDGIRDDLVTGVQTCALPISSNGGATWTEISSDFHLEIEFHPTDSDIVYTVSRDRKSVV